MHRRIRIHSDFAADVATQLEWIDRSGPETWRDRLQEDINDTLAALEQFPELGTLVSDAAANAAHGAELRQLILRRTPFVVWYVTVAGSDVWLLPLFHVRQDRPRQR